MKYEYISLTNDSSRMTHSVVQARAAILLFLIASLFSTATWAATPPETDKGYYTFAVVPQQSASKLTKLWAPVLKNIERQSGVKLVLKTAPDIPTFERRVSNLEYDFAYMNPYHFTVFNLEPGYQAVAKAKDKKIKGIIVVRKDSMINELQALNGKTLSFPAPAAFAASVLPRAALTQMGIKFTPKYVQTHDSVYLTVERKLYAAGGGVKRTYESMPNNVKSQLRILWTSPGYTPHAIASKPELDINIKNKVQHALLTLNEKEDGAAALSSLRIKGFIAANNSDWDDVRGLGLDLLRNLQEF